MNIYPLAFVCAFLPILTAHITLFIALSFENLSMCNPYWSDCHSISATGRQYPEFFVFKALMIPAAVCMIGYWLFLGYWLKRLSANSINLVVTLGVIAALALIIYTVTLGAKGEPYALARRIGVVLFFSFTAFAHLLTLAKLYGLTEVHTELAIWIGRLRFLCILLLALGVFSAFLGFFWSEYSRWDNAFEWWFSLLMMGQFYFIGTMWKNSNFRIKINMKL